jgi:ubiquitin-like-conjugating enzyme ATG3
MAANGVFNVFKGVAEYFTPVMTQSQFNEKGMLTPEEFVLAGDQLVFKCPTWQWASGDPAMRKAYLPADKQYLITRNVPSLCRAHTFALADAKEILIEDEDGEGWLATHMEGEHVTSTGISRSGAPEEEEIGDMEDMIETKTETKTRSKEPEETHQEQLGEVLDEIPDIPDMDAHVTIPGGGPLIQINENYMSADAPPDMEDFVGEVVDEEDDGTLLSAPAPILSVSEPNDNVVLTRTYDLSITYDKFYATPRVFLFGYDEHRRPLSNEQIMDDISSFHAHKTVTVEPHPHLGIPHASIHPCRHASVMKKIVDQMERGFSLNAPEAKESASATDQNTPRARRIQVDQYLILFLKFVSSVIPTIEYDFTSSVG